MTQPAHVTPRNTVVVLGRGNQEFQDDDGNRIALFNGVTRKFEFADGASLAIAGIDLTTLDGLGVMGVAHAIFDPSGDATMRTAVAHGLGVTIPSGAIVCGGFARVETAFTSDATNAGTVAIHVQGANDIISAAAVSGAPWSTTGLKAIVPKANTPESTGILLTAARELTATVAIEAMLTGKAHVFAYYLRS